MPTTQHLLSSSSNVAQTVMPQTVMKSYLGGKPTYISAGKPSEFKFYNGMASTSKVPPVFLSQASSSMPSLQIFSTTSRVPILRYSSQAISIYIFKEEIFVWRRDFSTNFFLVRYFSFEISQRCYIELTIINVQVDTITESTKIPSSCYGIRSRSSTSTTQSNTRPNSLFIHALWASRTTNTSWRTETTYSSQFSNRTIWPLSFWSTTRQSICRLVFCLISARFIK